MHMHPLPTATGTSPELLWVPHRSLGVLQGTCPARSASLHVPSLATGEGRHIPPSPTIFSGLVGTPGHFTPAWDLLHSLLPLSPDTCEHHLPSPPEAAGDFSWDKLLQSPMWGEPLKADWTQFLQTALGNVNAL